MSISHEQLASQIAEVAVLRGEFTLRSGRTSNYYLDKYLFTTRPDLLGPLAIEFAAKVEAMEARLGQRADRLAGAVLGGIPIVTAVCLQTGRPSVLVRAEKKDYGTAKQLEGRLEQGEHIIVLEDIATSGGQSVEAVKVLRAAGAKVLGVIVAIDRQEGAREAIEAQDVAFDSVFTSSDLGITG